MKNITEYIVNESKTCDLFMTVGQNIKGHTIEDADIDKIIKDVQKQYKFTLTRKEAETLAQSIIDEFPEMINK